MSTRSPRVSVGLPVYNGASFLQVSIDSILGQTFEDLELVISDNASTDETQRICEEAAALDSRVRYTRNETNRGPYFNFNRVFELSRGEYFKWASHDDWVSPRYIEECVAEADQDPLVVLAYGQMCRVHAQLNTKVMIHKPEPIVRSRNPAMRLHDALWDLPYYPIFGLFRSSALGNSRGLMNVPEPDRILLAEVALQGRFAQVPDVTLFQRPSRRPDTWLWLDPKNRSRPLLKTFRFGKALLETLSASEELDSVDKVLALPDLLAYVVFSRIRGKLRQYRRRLKLGYGSGPSLDPDTVDGIVADLLEQETR